MIIGVNARLLLTHRMEGIARYTWESLKVMFDQHPEDQFILFFDRKFDPLFVQANNVEGVVVYPQARHPILWKIWFDYMIPRAVRKHKVDVFWSPDGFASKVLSVKQLMTTHDLTYLHFPESMRTEQLGYYQRNVPLFHRFADHISTVSEATKKDVMTSLAIEDKKISVAMNALTKEVIPQRERMIKDEYLLYLGSIHPRKNIVRLLEAYDDFRSKNSGLSPKMVLAGRRAFGNDDLDRLVSKMDFGEDVIFTGMVSDIEKQNLLKHARIFIYVSLFEGFGIPILEAMEAGVPVITSHSGALAEVSGGSTLGLDPTKKEEITDAIEKLYNDDLLRQELIRMGHRRTQDFSWEDTASKIYMQIQKLYKDK